MTVAQLIAKKFGIKTRSTRNPLVNEVDDVVTPVLPNNPNRLGYSIVNLSGNNVYISLDQEVATNHGVLLTPNGGSMTMTMDEDFEATCWAAWGIATAANSDIFVIEVLIDKIED